MSDNVYCFGDGGGPGWREFIAERDSGRVVEIDETMFNYWLGVMPPVWLRRTITWPDGFTARNTVGHAEGREPVVALWCSKGRFFCRKTEVVNDV